MRNDTSGARAVVVGYDGSPGAAGALVHAAGEAALRRIPLRVVHVRQGAPGPSTDAVATRAADILRRTAPEVEVTYEEDHGVAAARLVAASRDADLLVVGRGALAELAEPRGAGDSVAYDVVLGAACAVTVIAASSQYRASAHDVVVGVDPAHDIVSLLEMAFAEAAQRHSGLVVIHASDRPVPAEVGLDTWSRGGVEPGLAEIAKALHAAVHEAQVHFPPVPISEVIQHGAPTKILRDASLAARLIVLGGPRRAPDGGVFLGPVGQHLLRHARCPVLLAPSSATGAAHASGRSVPGEHLRARTARETAGATAGPRTASPSVQIGG
jgi:nucleotide-binding universal stress UspA family protein